jgi:hypothetical protein
MSRQKRSSWLIGQKRSSWLIVTSRTDDQVTARSAQ